MDKWRPCKRRDFIDEIEHGIGKNISIELNRIPQGRRLSGEIM